MFALVLAAILGVRCQNEIVVQDRLGLTRATTCSNKESYTVKVDVSNQREDLYLFNQDFGEILDRRMEHVGTQFVSKGVKPGYWQVRPLDPTTIILKVRIEPE